MEKTIEQATLPETQNQLIDIRSNTVVQIVLLGVLLGAVDWLLTLFLDRFVLHSILCTAQSTSCGGTPEIAGNIALVLTAVGGLLGLVRLGVYRPLLIVIASVIVLWGLGGWVSGLLWYEALAWTVALYAITYITFAWLVRPRLFLTAIILVLIVLALARLLPVLL